MQSFLPWPVSQPKEHDFRLRHGLPLQWISPQFICLSYQQGDCEYAATSFHSLLYGKRSSIPERNVSTTISQWPGWQLSYRRRELKGLASKQKQSSLEHHHAPSVLCNGQHLPIWSLFIKQIFKQKDSTLRFQLRSWNLKQLENFFFQALQLFIEEYQAFTFFINSK